MTSSGSPRKGIYIPGWVKLGLVVFCVAILVALLAVPQGTTCGIGTHGELKQAYFNARKLFVAASRMSMDFEVSQNSRLGWPGDLASSRTDPVHDFSSYVERLIEFNYLTRADLQIFAAPGVEPYPGTGPLTMKNSAFKIYLVKGTDVQNVLFFATKNFTFGQGLHPDAKPFGDKDGFVVVRKSGEVIFSSFKNRALNTNFTGLMPGHTEQNDPGRETSQNVWLD